MRFRKIINDPVYGFIAINSPLIFEIISHPWYQRLRRIKQMALAHLVYPGAVHTRLHHSLGAYHLMCSALGELKNKGIEITEEEETGAQIAILLHDIGHGPFSHALESVLMQDVHHEEISLLLMKQLNEQFLGQLETAIDIFTNAHPKKFLHQLVSGQLDVDRMDYLTRDSFFTGVSEGVIGYDRIIKMLTVYNGELVVEEKAIYSIEKFLVARRLMYWQVYLHKTVLSAETLLVHILKRAKELAAHGHDLFATPALKLFLENNFTKTDFEKKPSLLADFSKLDDSDVIASIKVWCDNSDKILARLCLNLLDRKLFKIEIQNTPISKDLTDKLIKKTMKLYGITAKEASYFVFTDKVNNSAYNASKFNINILMGNGQLIDVAQASDQLNIQSLSKTVTKHFICYPKELIS